MTIGEQRRYAFWFGAIFLILLFISFIMVYLFEIYKVEQLFALFVFFFRVVLAGSLAGVAAMIPGYFNIDWGERLGLRAGGAFAVFLLIYTVNPPALIADFSQEAKASDLFLACDQLRGGVEPSADTRIYCIELAENFPGDWRGFLGMAKLRNVEGAYEASLDYALEAVGAFQSNNGTSVFAAASNPESDYHFDAQKVLHTLNIASWGVGAYYFSNYVLGKQQLAGMISPEYNQFLQKFNSAQATSRFVRLFRPEDLLGEQPTEYDYELFYDSCLLSWFNAIQPSARLKSAGLEMYQEFRSALAARDGTNAPTQRDHIDCLERDFGNLGLNCGSSIGVPTYCPVFGVAAEAVAR